MTVTRQIEAAPTSLVGAAFVVVVDSTALILRGCPSRLSTIATSSGAEATTVRVPTTIESVIRWAVRTYGDRPLCFQESP